MKKYTHKPKRGQFTNSEILNYLSNDGRGYFCFGFSYNSNGYYDIFIYEIPAGFITLPKPHSPYSRCAIGKITFPPGQERSSLAEAKLYAKSWAQTFWQTAKNWQTITDNK